MKQRVALRPKAEEYLRDAFLWYEDRRMGLGHSFLLRVDAGLKSIERNPGISQLGYKGTRRYFIKRFPYKIIYLSERQRIVVLAVIHERRSPELVKERMDGM